MGVSYEHESCDIAKPTFAFQCAMKWWIMNWNLSIFIFSYEAWPFENKTKHKQNKTKQQQHKTQRTNDKPSFNMFNHIAKMPKKLSKFYNFCSRKKHLRTNMTFRRMSKNYMPIKIIVLSNPKSQVVKYVPQMSYQKVII